MARKLERPPRRRRVPAAQATDGHSSTSVVRKRSGKVVEETAGNDRHPNSESILNPAHVTVGGSVTKNLGDYESAKVTVQLTRPCVDDSAAIERTFNECAEWVDEKIKQELGKV